MSLPRKAAATMTVGASIFGLWFASEGFRPDAHIPVKGDRPTIGIGSTYYEDGAAVQLTDPPITRKRAEELAYGELDKRYGACVKTSLGSVLINEVEFRNAVDFAGQYGCGAWITSSMVPLLRAGKYKQACEAYLSFKYMTSPTKLGTGWEPYRANSGILRYRFDCSTPGNKTCRGVWTRQMNRYNDCMAAL